MVSGEIRLPLRAGRANAFPSSSFVPCDQAGCACMQFEHGAADSLGPTDPRDRPVGHVKAGPIWIRLPREHQRMVGPDAPAHSRRRLDVGLLGQTAEIRLAIASRVMGAAPSGLCPASTRCHPLLIGHRRRDLCGLQRAEPPALGQTQTIRRERPLSRSYLAAAQETLSKHRVTTWVVRLGLHDLGARPWIGGLPPGENPEKSSARPPKKHDLNQNNDALGRARPHVHARE